MNFKSKFLLALLTAVSYSYVMVADDRDEEQTYESRRRKVCKCCSLVVSGNGSFGGNVSVTGSITGGSFALSPAAAVGTAGLPGVGGLLAWGEVEKTSAQTTSGFPEVVNMSASGASNNGITPVTGAAGGLLIALPGVYLFEYYTTLSTATLATIDLFNLNTTTEVPNSLVGNGSASIGQISGAVIAVITAPSTTIQLRFVSGGAPAVVANDGTTNSKIRATRIA